MAVEDGIDAKGIGVAIDHVVSQVVEEIAKISDPEKKQRLELKVQRLGSLKDIAKAAICPETWTIPT